ncbi:MAG: PepSY domain-containing protein [Deltaproteobacteria bacterium]|nr:PepSY domain-containing protein [Deltaproteobacteria bacterium]
MKKLIIVFAAMFLVSSDAFAQMGGGHMGGGAPGTHMGGGSGYGMRGYGGMVSRMMGKTISHGYLDILTPLENPGDARAAIQSFIDASSSSLQISELWEYETAYKAELSDLNGARAFDLIADRFTGAVAPEMGLSMMMNASYGKGIYKTPSFGKKLKISAEQATAIAQDFVNDNSLSYSLATPEDYPGYYKFHTTDSTGFGLDVMVNGYNGGIWMNTVLGKPVGKF